MNREEGMALVLAAVADALGVEPAKVLPTSRLVSDLGADSLDFVELMFVLEKKFGVVLRRSELDFLARAGLGNAAGGSSGAPFTQDELRQLRRWLPAIDSLPRDERITPAKLSSLITPETLWIVIEEKLAGAGV